MNCEDMMKMPELKNALQLRAGANGIKHSIRWIYFADCLECIKNEYPIENYIHGSEFVVLTNRSLTNNSEKLKVLISKMQKYDIAALGINEGQISDDMIVYCNENNLPLFELIEKFPLVDLSQIICQRLIFEENNKNSAEQLFSSILEADESNKEHVLEQARFLHINLSGEFCVIEFQFCRKKHIDKENIFHLGNIIRCIITTEFSYDLSENILTKLQDDAVLAFVPVSKITEIQLKTILNQIVHYAQKEYQIILKVGVGNATEYLENVKVSRNEAAESIKIADISKSKDSIFFYKNQGIYTLISQISDGKFLDEFVDRYIGKLIHADEVNNSNLCETLESYLNHNCNAKYTAEVLYIHRNTLNYRLKKIYEILGEKFEDMDSCLALKLAFMIRNYRNLYNKKLR